MISNLRMDLRFKLYFLSTTTTTTTTTHLRHQETRGVGGAQHVDEEVVGQHIELLDLLSLGHSYSVTINITKIASIQTWSHLDIGVAGCPEEV